MRTFTLGNPEAIERQRAQHDHQRFTMVVNGREVEGVHCDCGREMPAARLKYPVLGGMCEVCTRHARAAKPAAPEYETEVWAQGGRL